MHTGYAAAVTNFTDIFFYKKLFHNIIIYVIVRVKLLINNVFILSDKSIDSLFALLLYYKSRIAKICTLKNGG